MSRRTNEYYARNIMSDEAWDMLWESLKEYCKVNNLEEEYIKYDNIFRSVLLYNKQEFINGALAKIYDMFYITDGCEFDE